MTPRCFRCGGTVRVEVDEDGENIGQCMACSALQPHEAVNGEEPVQEQRSGFTAITSDWKAGALAELKKHIATVQSAESARVEGEKLHRLLSEFGVTVPDLPWKSGNAAESDPKPRNWTPGEKALLIERVSQGVSAADIAAELGRPVTSVYSQTSNLRTRGDIPK